MDLQKADHNFEQWSLDGGTWLAGHRQERKDFNTFTVQLSRTANAAEATAQDKRELDDAIKALAAQIKELEKKKKELTSKKKTSRELVQKRKKILAHIEKDQKKQWD